MQGITPETVFIANSQSVKNVGCMGCVEISDRIVGLSRRILLLVWWASLVFDLDIFSVTPQNTSGKVHKPSYISSFRKLYLLYSLTNLTD